jgi:hypothetical protein
MLSSAACPSLPRFVDALALTPAMTLEAAIMNLSARDTPSANRAGGAS